MNNNQVMIITVDGALRIVGLLGPTPAKLTEGFGGWDIVDRPRKTGLTQYNGRSPFHMSLNILFDGYIMGTSQESNLRILTWMFMPPKGGHEPRPVKIVGGAIPFPSGGEWVLNGLTYGDQTIWSNTAIPARVRQDVTLELIEHIVADRLQFIEPGSGLAPNRTSPYTVKVGDTIQKIAQFFYGDYTRWHEISDANFLADPSNLKPGMHLRIP